MVEEKDSPYKRHGRLMGGGCACGNGSAVCNSQVELHVSIKNKLRRGAVG